MDNEHIKISGCVSVDNRCFNDEFEEKCRVREMLAEQLTREGFAYLVDRIKRELAHEQSTTLEG